MSANQSFALTLYTACMKKINTQVGVIRRNGFRGKCFCFFDVHAHVVPIERQHGGAICLSAGQSPPVF